MDAVEVAAAFVVERACSFIPEYDPRPTGRLLIVVATRLPLASVKRAADGCASSMGRSKASVSVVARLRSALDHRSSCVEVA
jgi:hypothetical protein